jgi:hypothetical protein
MASAAAEWNRMQLEHALYALSSLDFRSIPQNLKPVFYQLAGQVDEARDEFLSWYERSARQ